MGKLAGIAAYKAFERQGASANASWWSSGSVTKTLPLFAPRLFDTPTGASGSKWIVNICTGLAVTFGPFSDSGCVPKL
jgi:hypothetical protein